MCKNRFKTTVIKNKYLLTCKLISISSNYKYNTRTAQMYKNETLNKQNKNNMAAGGKQQYK